jgi:hypothetical protein
MKPETRQAIDEAKVNMNYRQEILDRIKYFYGQVDFYGGIESYKFPNSAEGDLLKMVYRINLSGV